MAPIDHGAGNQIRIRHNDTNIVAGYHRRAAQVDFGDASDRATNLDSIPNGDGLLSEDDQPADEVANDVLQAEADPDAQRSRQKCERAEVDANCCKRKVNAEDQECVSNDLTDRKLNRSAQASPLKNPSQEDSTKHNLTYEHDDEEDDELKQVSEGKLSMASSEQREVQQFSPFRK